MAKPGKIEGLECDLNAVEGIRLVLAGRFKEMASFSDAALVWEDPEGVHDMRVASRRLRSALKDFVPFMRERPLMEGEKKIKDIANALGTVRDHDVLIDALEKFMASCPAHVVDGIESLIEERKKRRIQGREILQKAIQTAKLEVLRADFEKAIEKAVKGRDSKPGDLRYAQGYSFKEIGAKIVSDRINEFNKRSPSVFEPFRRKRLHRLRIAGKHLRYTLQLFAECLPESFNGIVEPVTNLQRALGDLHDADVFVGELSSDLADSAVKSPANTGSSPEHSAEVWLLSEYTRLRSGYYREALEEWEFLQPRLLINAAKAD
jgi:CHAD domain-containing protein